MIQIKNKLFQPLVYHLAGGRTLHLGPRGRAEIAGKDVSEELRRAERRGLVALSEKLKPGTKSSASAVSDAEPVQAESQANHKRRK
jgi:hypothetical protein